MGLETKSFRWWFPLFTFLSERQGVEVFLPLKGWDSNVYEVSLHRVNNCWLIELIVSAVDLSIYFLRCLSHTQWAKRDP